MRKRKAPPHCFWVGSVLWGRQTIRGKKERWSLRTDDVEVAAQRVEADRKRNLELANGTGRVTWEDAVTGWIEHHIPDRGIGLNAAKRYAVSLKQCEPWLRGRYQDEVDAALVVDLVNGRRKADVTTATLRRDLGAVASVLTYCQTQNWRRDNPALERLRLLKERRDPIVLPETTYVDRVIRRAPGLMAALIRAARLTGCRLEELVTATRAAINHERHELTVIGKGNKLRVIGLDYGGAYELLRGLPTYAKSPWLFWHDEGEPYRNLSSRFAAIVRDVAATEAKAAKEEGREPEFRPFRFHDLRHLHAVEWLRAGLGLYDLQQRLGHKSITTTEIYLKFLTAEEARQSQHQGTQMWTQQPIPSAAK
jgi:integrase/recombinase XerD